MGNRVRLPLLLALHLVVSAGAAAALAWNAGYGFRAVATHLLIVAEWDLLLLALPLPRLPFRFLLGLTWAVQISLYALNVVSTLSWDRNMTAHLVTAFAPTVWSGREPFPVGPAGITAFGAVTILLIASVLGISGRAIDEAMRAWRERRRGARALALTLVMAAAFVTTVGAGIAGRDNLYWKNELVASFFRPEGYAFEPTERREAMARRDAAIRAAYPKPAGAAHRKNVILIIVDSLRADRMQVYGYPRTTTPFLAEMVGRGRMKQVRDAFSTCSESFCGITSTLASREFQDISAETFNLQDVLHDQGYQTRFLLSGNHRAWNGLPRFYHVGDGPLDTFFDGSRTRCYTMDDDRLVLEGLEHVPPASPDRPAFFYIHLMSTHYLGVQFEESHVFTRSDDRVSPGLEPYKMLDKLNKPDRYDDKVLQADGMIRRLFDALGTKHYLDDAVLVVTGDHGEGLGERHWAHGWHLYNEDIRVPLLLYDSPAATYPDLTFGVQLDIAPTILDRLGLPIPASWEGESLLRPSKQRFTRHQTYFVPNRFAVLYRDADSLFKFIATPQYGQEELYDLRTDARERHDLAKERPALEKRLRDTLAF